MRTNKNLVLLMEQEWEKVICLDMPKRKYFLYQNGTDDFSFIGLCTFPGILYFYGIVNLGEKYKLNSLLIKSFNKHIHKSQRNALFPAYWFTSPDKDFDRAYRERKDFLYKMAIGYEKQF